MDEHDIDNIERERLEAALQRAIVDQAVVRFATLAGVGQRGLVDDIRIVAASTSPRHEETEASCRPT